MAIRIPGLCRSEPGRSRNADRHAPEYAFRSGRGEIGRRSVLRWLRPQGPGGSNPPFRTNVLLASPGHKGTVMFFTSDPCATLVFASGELDHFQQAAGVVLRPLLD